MSAYLAPVVAAQAQTNALSGAPEITFTVQNPNTEEGLLIITRGDGYSLPLASPSNDHGIAPGGTTVISDPTAPYGVKSSYVVYLYFNGVTSPTTAVSATMGVSPDALTLYGRLGWAASEDTSGELLSWLGGIADLFQTIDSLTHDGYDTEGNVAPGWSQVLDLNRCPTFALPWLGQFVGVQVNPTLRDDQQRAQILSMPGFQRGTVASIIAAIDYYLLPGYSATIVERTPDAYSLEIFVPLDGYVNGMTCGGLWLQYPTCTAVEDAFDTCENLWAAPNPSSAGPATCATLAADYATCADVEADFATCAALWATDSLILAGITDTIPAGLVATISFV